MSHILAAYIPLFLIGFGTVLSYHLDFARRFGLRAAWIVARPEWGWLGLYELLTAPAVYPFLGLRRLLDPEGAHKVIGETLVAMVEAAMASCLELEPADVAQWAEELRGNE